MTTSLRRSAARAAKSNPVYTEPSSPIASEDEADEIADTRSVQRTPKRKTKKITKPSKRMKKASQGTLPYDEEKDEIESEPKRYGKKRSEYSKRGPGSQSTEVILSTEAREVNKTSNSKSTFFPSEEKDLHVVDASSSSQTQKQGVVLGAKCPVVPKSNGRALDNADHTIRSGPTSQDNPVAECIPSITSDSSSGSHAISPQEETEEPPRIDTEATEDDRSEDEVKNHSLRRAEKVRVKKLSGGVQIETSSKKTRNESRISEKRRIKKRRTKKRARVFNSSSPDDIVEEPSLKKVAKVSARDERDEPSGGEMTKRQSTSTSDDKHDEDKAIDTAVKDGLDERMDWVCKETADSKDVAGVVRENIVKTKRERRPVSRGGFGDKRKTSTGNRKSKMMRCECAGCLRPNCEECIFCRDMKKYGGPGTLRQRCSSRACVKFEAHASFTNRARVESDIFSMSPGELLKSVERITETPDEIDQQAYAKFLPTDEQKHSEETHYCEETAWQLHNSPEVASSFSPFDAVSEADLQPLPPAPPLPPLPATNDCEWTFDEKSRVLLANFRQTTGSVTINSVDERFLLEMMERDDLTVISEGLADELDVKLWNETYIVDRVGSEFFHKFRRFRRRVVPENLIGTPTTKSLPSPQNDCEAPEKLLTDGERIQIYSSSAEASHAILSSSHIAECDVISKHSNEEKTCEAGSMRDEAAGENQPSASEVRVETGSSPSLESNQGLAENNLSTAFRSEDSIVVHSSLEDKQGMGENILSTAHRSEDSDVLHPKNNDETDQIGVRVDSPETVPTEENATGCAAGSSSESSLRIFHEEMDGFMALRVRDFFEYLNKRRKSIQSRIAIGASPFKPNKMETQDETETFDFYDETNCHQQINVVEDVLYMVDYDIIKLLPILYDDFRRKFKLPEFLPGGEHCLMNPVNGNGRPFMGPNLYMTPPASFTQFHQDGYGTVDSGHLCISGFNEVVMLRRLTERHKRHAMKILQCRDGKERPNQSYDHDALYQMPHSDGAKPPWPDVTAIGKCADMNYYPSVFILKPGQLVHINKGRLHAFRKLSPSVLDPTDCHSLLREKLIEERQLCEQESTCISVAWDWMFRGVTDDGINREVSSILECASLNRVHRVQSLAIPEVALLHLARETLARHSRETSAESQPSFMDQFVPMGSVKSSLKSGMVPSLSILRGIMPSLRHVLALHKEALTRALRLRASSDICIEEMPNVWIAPEVSTVDPYGNGDFACKYCYSELSNPYMHCDGCEVLLERDFNICITCYEAGVFKNFCAMKPSSKLRNSQINHTGDVSKAECSCDLSRQLCKSCRKCALCLCRCHQKFTLYNRFWTQKDEQDLLNQIEEVAGGDKNYSSTTSRLELIHLQERDRRSVEMRRVKK